jgi:hypothetical protein
MDYLTILFAVFAIFWSAFAIQSIILKFVHIVKYQGWQFEMASKLMTYLCMFILIWGQIFGVVNIENKLFFVFMGFGLLFFFLAIGYDELFFREMKAQTNEVKKNIEEFKAKKMLEEKHGRR